MTKTVTLRLDEDVYAELREAATAERQPLSNLIETAALARVREGQFVDDVEMAETLENDDLSVGCEPGRATREKVKGRSLHGAARQAGQGGLRSRS